MAKFVTVTPNPAIDRTYVVGDFTTGEVTRAENVVVGAGGKGINVARALRTLGADVATTGFAGGLVGEQFVALLDSEGIEHDFVDVSPAETRFSIVIADHASQQQTVVNEHGPELAASDAPELQRHLSALASGASGIVFSGSLPPGISPKRYRTIVESVKSRGCLTLLDATGDVLLECIGAKPSILKINRNEARSLGVIIEDWNTRALDVAREIGRNLGIDYVALTDGARGAVLAAPNGLVKVQMPKLTVASAVGSGDSFAAGLIYALATRPDDLPEALRLAAACGGANALSDAPGVFTREQLAWVSGRITIG